MPTTSRANSSPETGANPVEADTNPPGRNQIRRIGPLLNRFALPLLLFAMCALFTAAEPRFLSTSNASNVARNSSDLALLATGEAFVLLFGQVDISVGSIVGASSVVTAWSVQQVGMVGICAGTLFGAFIGFINGTIVARFKIHSVIVTIGMLTALRGWTLWVTNGQPVFGGMPESFLTLGSGYVAGIPIPTIIAATVMVGAAVMWRFTRFGPAMYAIGGNEEAAHLAGIPVYRYTVMAFVMSGALAGLAGTILASRINSGQPNLGTLMELDAIAAAVIGGMALAGGRGTIGGVALGVATLALIRNGLNLTNVSSFLQMMITGLVIIGAVIADKLRNSDKKST